MKSLFDEITPDKIGVKNRLVRSATFEYGGNEDGNYKKEMYDIYEDLAKDGVGKLKTTEGNVIHYGFIENFIEELGTKFNIKETGT